MTILFDMDGVLADYAAGLAAGGDGHNKTPGFFLDLPPIEGGIEAFKLLSETHDCYICSTAPWSNPLSYTEKREWVERYLGDYSFKRLILTNNKSLMRADILIDDRTANGADEFVGHHIHFGQAPFENWEKVVAYLSDYEANEEKLLDRLFSMVDARLRDCDSLAFPTICQMRNTPEGLDMVKNYVANLVINNDNLSVMQAILLTEQQYSINSTN